VQEMVQIITNYGILVVIAAIFIWDKVVNVKQTEKILSELQAASRMQTAAIESIRIASDNTATALQIIQNTLTATSTALERHDKRSEFMNSDLRDLYTFIMKDNEQFYNKRERDTRN